MYIKEKQSTNSIDLDDLIIIATHLAPEIQMNYKYIIIDEFQDTSMIRLNLITEIQKQCNSKIIAVGDDWQSIYRFSGCDLNIFLNFEKKFKNVSKFFLTKTYRNSHELIKIASKFIMKNNKQIKKNMNSTKSLKHPIELIAYTQKVKTFKKIIDKILNYSKDIMILYRNNKDIYNYIDKEFTLDNNVLHYKNARLKHYSVHKSKGLESEYVILINCNNEKLGFPNKIEDNQIIQKIIKYEEMKYAEERRLFYVAITRTKEKVFILYDKNNPSIFIKEIKKIL